MYDINYQSGAYYDMRYMQYFTRYKFILGLSKYNDDDTALEREEEMKVMGNDCESSSVLDLKTQKTKVKQGKMDDDLVNDSRYHCSFGEMVRYIGENKLFDKVVDEFLLNTYNDIDEQEFQVCKTVIWTMWDTSTPFYLEVVARILNPSHEKRSKIFSNIKEVEETIQRLVRKGILSQEVNYICTCDKNGNTRQRYDEPHIILPFTKDPDEALKAISEIFSQECKSFFGPHIDYDKACGLE
jgi:hypothetical protein